MIFYTIFIIIGSILFISSIVLWFRSGMIKRKNNTQSKKDDNIGGYMFISSLFSFTIALLIWLLA
ncbi:hypothetical protein [Prevotella sp. 10(H)]|uniref:hypothetical protein n=1 Tax=Prevotella sp. 10(H) TaxID=1158294 RepID=UPI0004A725A3|nr:hypothetical protein [Prevotella sp. 10(H)]